MLDNQINRFVGDFAFLSNFFPSTIVIGGKSYATVEHAYQAFKTNVQHEHETVRMATSPELAKRLGRSVSIKNDWDATKIDLMRMLIRLKFENPILREMLLATGDSDLIETNYWNDTFWGICKGVGTNWLGKILEEVRTEISAENAAENAV